MAVLTLTVPDAEVPRLRAAFGRLDRMNPPGTLATAEEIRQELIRYAKSVVLAYERENASITAQAAIIEPPIN